MVNAFPRRAYAIQTLTRASSSSLEKTHIRLCARQVSKAQETSRRTKASLTSYIPAKYRYTFVLMEAIHMRILTSLKDFTTHRVLRRIHREKRKTLTFFFEKKFFF